MLRDSALEFLKEVFEKEKSGEPSAFKGNPSDILDGRASADYEIEEYPDTTTT